MRLIRENTEDRVAQAFAALLLILLVRQLNVILGCLRIHGVHIGVAVVVGVLFHFNRTHQKQRLICFVAGLQLLAVVEVHLVFQPAGKGRHQVFLTGRHTAALQNLHTQRAHAVSRVLGHPAAGDAGGPAVLIIEPGLQTAFLRLIRALIGQAEPVFPQIFRLKPGTGMHEEAPEAHIFQYIDSKTKTVWPGVLPQDF